MESVPHARRERRNATAQRRTLAPPAPVLPIQRPPSPAQITVPTDTGTRRSPDAENR